jgi:hypothetical protein
MRIDNIVAMLDEGGPKSYYSFETFILNLLDYHIKLQKKDFLTVNHIQRFGDALAPDGFDDFSGATLIEIKFNLDKLPIKHFVNRQLIRFLENEDYKTIEQILIIVAKPVSSRTYERLEKELKNINFPIPVKIWGPNEINKIVTKHQKKTKEITNNLFSLRLEFAVKKPQEDWKEARKKIIAQLKEYYNKGQFSLFLGAGVSSSSGMPDWNTLLNSLFVSYLTQEFNSNGVISDTDISDLVNRLNTIDEPSALMAARYLRKGLSKGKDNTLEFTNTISKNLYKLRNQDFPLDSDLIKTITTLCLPKRTGAKVRSVITYNFDDLLERQLENQAIEYQSIYTDDAVYTLDELPIYHVHGFLPEDISKYSSLNKSTLVFSEEGYHEIYSNSYHWSNLVQLNNLRENHCLMIGLSMSDPNLRRLLDISGKNMEKAKHFAFMQRMSLENFAYQKNKNDNTTEQVISNTDGAELFLERHHSLNEEIMKELGVTIIWYEGYDDIPNLLNELLNSK